MTSAAHHRFSFSDYLWLEEASETKHEFFDGQVFAMAGGTPDYSGIKVNVVAALTAQLFRRPCRVFDSDLRVRVKATGLSTYPDASVVCGHVELDPEDAKGHTITNPMVLVEVLSPSTEAYDRGERLRHYKQIDSLREIVLVAHDVHRLEVWRRGPSGWSLEVSEGEGGRVTLQSVPCVLTVAEVYRDPLAAP